MEEVKLTKKELNVVLSIFCLGFSVGLFLGASIAFVIFLSIR